MAERQKKLRASEDKYYFGGPVPREIQSQLEACRDRGMTVQNIAKKLAYLWLRLSPEKQHQLYFSLIDEQDSAADKKVLDLMQAVDQVVSAQIRARLPETVRAIETVGAAQRKVRKRKPSLP